MTLLSVNLNAVAQLRNRRDLPWPSVVGMARIVLDAGASGITIHPRPDDPQQVTLVPDGPEQATSDHGWDFRGKVNYLTSMVIELKAPGRRISLFCDSDAGAAGVTAAKAVGADRIELYTGPYGGCYADPDKAEYELAALSETARAAHAIGLGVNAGHDLTLANLPAFQAAVPGVEEVSIGHGITADALEMGFAAAVKAYLAVLGD
jgi:pyridoxine 5-phosphate synthase